MKPPTRQFGFIYEMERNKQLIKLHYVHGHASSHLFGGQSVLYCLIRRLADWFVSTSFARRMQRLVSPVAFDLDTFTHICIYRLTGL